MNYQTVFLYSDKQNNCKTTTGQKFRRGQKFRLTPVKRNDPRCGSTCTRVEPSVSGSDCEANCCRYLRLNPFDQRSASLVFADRGIL